MKNRTLISKRTLYDTHLTPAIPVYDILLHNPNRLFLPQLRPPMNENPGHSLPIPDVICHQSIVWMTVNSLQLHLKWNKRTPIRNIFRGTTENYAIRVFTPLHTTPHIANHEGRLPKQRFESKATYCTVTDCNRFKLLTNPTIKRPFLLFDETPIFNANSKVV